MRTSSEPGAVELIHKFNPQLVLTDAISYVHKAISHDVQDTLATYTHLSTAAITKDPSKGMANSEYQLQLRTLHNELAPIHRLPSEVLQSIMLAVTFAIIEQSKLMKVAVWGDQWWKRGVLVCSHVCRLWRETALAYPGLWTGIFIPPPDLDLLKEILRRSSRQPILMLNITRYTHERKFDRLDNWGDHRDDIEDAMDELHNAAYMSAIGEILQNQLHRVRCLRFVVNSIPWLDFLKWLNSPAPLLEELYIKGGADEMRTIIPHPTWFGSNTHKNPTPVLQRLYLKYCSPSFDFFFTCASLRELHIIHPTGWIPTRDFMPALLSLPQLEVLRLKWALEPVETPLPDDHPDLGEGDTYFPALRALFIQGNDSLTILHFLLPLHLPPSFHLRLLPHLQSTTPLEQPYDSESESESEFNNFTNDPSHEEGLFLTLLEQLSLFSNNHLEMDSSLYSPETKFNLRVRCIEEFNFHRKPGKLEYSYLYSYSFTPLIPSTTYIDYSDYDKNLPWFEFGFTSPDLSSTPHCDFTMDLVSSSNVVQWSFSGRAYEETGLFISNLPDLQSLETISVDGCGERVFNRLGSSVPKCDTHRKMDSYAENAGDESDLDWQGNSDVIKSLKAMTLAQVLEEFDPVERCNMCSLDPKFPRLRTLVFKRISSLSRWSLVNKKHRCLSHVGRFLAGRILAGRSIERIHFVNFHADNGDLERIKFELCLLYEHAEERWKGGPEIKLVNGYLDREQERAERIL